MVSALQPIKPPRDARPHCKPDTLLLQSSPSLKSYLEAEISSNLREVTKQEMQLKHYPVKMEIAGPTAMWTRPDTGDCPVSYPAPTFSAVRNIFQSILWGQAVEVSLAECGASPTT